MSSRKEKPSIEERVARSKKNAAKELAKSGLIQIRMEPAVLEEIYALAAEQGVRYTTLVRDWITASLARKVSAHSTVVGEIRELKDRVRRLEQGKVNESPATYSVADLTKVPTEVLLKELLNRDSNSSRGGDELESRKRRSSEKRKTR